MQEDLNDTSVNTDDINEDVISEISKSPNSLGVIKKPKNPIFKFDIFTKEISLVEFNSNIQKSGKNLVLENNHIYVIALNKRNALRKILRGNILFHTILNRDLLNKNKVENE